MAHPSEAISFELASAKFPGPRGLPPSVFADGETFLALEALFDLVSPSSPSAQGRVSREPGSSDAQQLVLHGEEALTQRQSPP